MDIAIYVSSVTNLTDKKCQQMVETPSRFFTDVPNILLLYHDQTRTASTQAILAYITYKAYNKKALSIPLYRWLQMVPLGGHRTCIGTEQAHTTRNNILYTVKRLRIIVSIYYRHKPSAHPCYVRIPLTQNSLYNCTPNEIPCQRTQKNFEKST